MRADRTLSIRFVFTLGSMSPLQRLSRPSHAAVRVGCVLCLLTMLATLLALPTQSSAQTANDEPTYVVELGDTLTAIAAKTGVSVADLIALNDVSDPDLLVAGQVLRLAPARTDPTRTYRVAAGDTLSRIAASTGTTVERLLTLNALADPDVLLVGQVLQLPAGAVAVVPTVTGSVVPQTRTLLPTSGALQATVQPGPTTLPTPTPTATPTGTARSPSPAFPTAGTAQPVPTILPGASSVLVTPGTGPTLEWRGSPNFWPGRPKGDPIGLVIHTAGGTLDGMDRWFATPDSESSAHFGIGLDGRVHQYVQLTDRAWANGYTEPGNRWPGPPDLNPNELTVSIEMEDWVAGPDVPEAQYQAAVMVGRLVLSRYPSIRLLITHRAIAPESRANDPGPRWVATGRFAALARDLGLAAIP